MYKFFGYDNEVDYQKISMQYDLSLEKFWITQCGCLRLCTNKIEKQYVTTRSNISTVMNEGVKMHQKKFTENFLTVIGPLLETSSTYIGNKNVSIGSSIYIRKPPITLNYNSHVIPSSLPSSFFFSSNLRSNGRSHQSRV